MSKFEDYMLEKNDRIDNAAQNLLNEMASAGIDWDEQVPWNMSVIGDIEDAVEEVLERHGIHHCHPYYEGDEEIECPDGKDCKRKDCPFRKEA